MTPGNPQDPQEGKVDEATYETSRSYLVVDTGPWIFGKHVLIPAGVIDRIDQDSETVYVSLAKEEIKNSPEWDDERGVDESYRAQVGDYYTTRR